MIDFHCSGSISSAFHIVTVDLPLTLVTILSMVTPLILVM